MKDDPRSNEDAIRDRINHLMSVVVDIDRHARAAMKPYIDQITYLQALLPSKPIVLPVVVDPTMPPGVVELRSGDQVVRMNVEKPNANP